MTSQAPARSPRTEIELACSLRRSVGSPIPALTLTVGPHGMRVRSSRPLCDDETIGFELPGLGIRVSGRARVMRAEHHNVYALRFEGLAEPMTRRLHALATSGC